MGVIASKKSGRRKWTFVRTQVTYVYTSFPTSWHPLQVVSQELCYASLLLSLVLEFEDIRITRLIIRVILLLITLPSPGGLGDLPDSVLYQWQLGRTVSFGVGYLFIDSV